MISGDEMNSGVVQFLPRERGEAEDMKLPRSELRRTMSSDWTLSGVGSLVGTADEC